MADAPLVQPQAFTAEGAPIPPEETAAAIASGKAYFQPGSKVVARTREGRLVTVPADSAAHPGLAVVSPAELAQINEARVYGKGLGNQAEAFGAGAARTLSLGLSDVAARGIGGEGAAHALDALRRQNPISSTAGEVAGAVAPLLVTGGGSAAVEGAEAAAEGSAFTRGASGVAGVAAAPMKAVGALGGAVEHGASSALGAAGLGGESLLGRAAAKAVSLGASGAVEGAVFGAGQTLSESALTGDPLTAESMAAGMGNGALFGGVLGAGIGAGGELLSGALNKAGPALKEGLENAATKFARKQLGRDFENVGKGMPREQAEAWKNADANLLLDRKLVGGENAGKTIFEASKKPADIADNLGQLKRDIGQELGQVRERAAEYMDQNPQLAPNPEELLKRVDEYVASLRKTKVAGNYALARTAEREVAPLRAAIEARAAQQIAPGAAAAEAGGEAGAINRLGVENADFNRDPESMRDMSVHRGGYEGATPEEVNAIARGERPTMNSDKPFAPVSVHVEADGQIHLNDGRHRLQAAKEAGAKDILATIRRYDAEGNIIAQQVAPVSIAALPDVPSGIVGNDTLPSMGYREILKWHSDLESSLNPAGVAKSMRGVAIKNFGAKQEVANIANAFLKESTAQALTAAGEDGSIVQRLHQQYAGTMAMQQAAEKEAKRVASNRHISLTDHMLGIGAALMHVASGNAGALASMGLGGAWAIGNKIAREQGNAMAAQIARRASRMTLLVDSAAKSLAGTGERIALPVRAAAELSEEPHSPPKREALPAEFNRFRERLQELSEPAHQQAQLSHATEKVQTAYPELAAALSQQLIHAQSYLASQLPPAAPGSGLMPLVSRPGFEPRQMQQFMDKARGALDPESVIHDLASGRINDDAVSALRAVYPQTFMQLRKKTIETVAANKNGLPYTRVVHLSRLFGFSGDPSLEPPRMASIQQSIAQISAPPGPGAPPGAPSKPKAARPGTPKLGKPYNLPGQATPGSK